MRVIKKKNRNYCHNCDWEEAEYTISNNGSFKLYWAYGKTDSEICFCKKCAEELYKQLGDALISE